VCRGDTAAGDAVAVAELVLVESDDPVAVVLLNRPQQPNALSLKLVDEDKTALKALVVP